MPDLITATALFACSFVVVFALGIQQYNLAARRPRAAFATSVLIGCASLVQFKVLPGPTGWLEIGAYFLGSALGAVGSIAADPLLVRLFERLRADAANHEEQH